MSEWRYAGLSHQVTVRLERISDLRHGLEHSPRDFGFDLTGWTTGLLQRLLRQSRGFHVSQDSLRNKLHELGYAWKRFRYTLRPDPQHGKKRIRRAIKELPAGTAILFEDETEVSLFPPLRSGWTKRGIPAEVVIYGGNAKPVVFGSLSLTGIACFWSVTINAPRTSKRSCDWYTIITEDTRSGC